MSLKRSQSTKSVLAFSAVFLAACGLGEIVSPAGPGALDANGNPIAGATGNKGTGVGDKSAVLNPSNTGAHASGAHAALSFSCNPDARTGKTLQRLSRKEYENTLRDVLSESTSPATATDVLKGIASALDSYPDDAVSKTAAFATMDQSVSQAHADSLMSIGTAVGAALTSSATRISELVGNCAANKTATATTMNSCVSDFIASFGKRVLRHELNQAERGFYNEVYAASGATVDAQGIADVVAVMLNAPDFVYRVEFGKDAVAGKKALFQLNDYEIATRLAYQFWQTTPDAELLAAADRGELSTDDGFGEALDRVLSDDRAGEGLEMFTREWLNLDSLRPLDSLNGTPIFDAFAGADKPSATLKEEMIQDLTDSIAFHALKQEGTLADWIESPYSFAQSDALAAIYNTPKWDGKSQPPRFPAGERAGLVTRAALLATGSANTRPIMKGVLIRESLLCDKLGAPPANAFGKLPDLSGEKTTRELVEAVTQDPQSNCAGCHTTQINPLGFATENFDSLGRKRDHQDLYDATGKVIASKPVDTSSVPGVWLQDSSPSTGAADLTSMLVDSGKVEACFARQWVRYAEARAEAEDTDGCELETVRTTLESGESLKEALKRYALLPQFRQRFVPAS
ncbi:MAG: Cellulose-binding domain protein [Myxococcaceae bacterium]|nr:Cellulose-binding domain protein [Myxococcaceae bacterium]